MCFVERQERCIAVYIVAKKKDPQADLTGSNAGTVDANINVFLKFVCIFKIIFSICLNLSNLHKHLLQQSLFPFLRFLYLVFGAAYFFVNG